MAEDSTNAPCPGVGRPWGLGTGAPICRVCHRGPGGLKVPRPKRRDETVPAHDRRVAP